VPSQNLVQDTGIPRKPVDRRTFRTFNYLSIFHIFIIFSGAALQAGTVTAIGVPSDIPAGIFVFNLHPFSCSHWKS